jgi:hypothetical protein
MQLVAITALTGTPVCNLVISNVPGPQPPLYFLGSRVTSMYPFGPIFHGAGLNLVPPIDPVVVD